MSEQDAAQVQEIKSTPSMPRRAFSRCADVTARRPSAFFSSRSAIKRSFNARCVVFAISTYSFSTCTRCERSRAIYSASQILNYFNVSCGREHLTSTSISAVTLSEGWYRGITGWKPVGTGAAAVVSAAFVP